jgi:ribonuclease HI
MKGIQAVNVYTDGSISHNPNGIMKYAFVVPELQYSESALIPDTKFNTNWVAEYTAVQKALEWLLLNGFEKQKIIINSDLEMLSITLSYKQPRAKPIEKSFHKALKEIYVLKPYFLDLSFNWIPREQNKDADKLSKIT